jgi:elongation factor Ts
MEITSAQLKELRDLTGISVMQCKKALEDAGGDMDKAKIILQKKGGEIALKKSDRELGAGAIGSYVHSTQEVAALVQLSCETDFVSKNAEFVALAREIAMHVAAQNPLYLNRAEVDEAALTQG